MYLIPRNFSENKYTLWLLHKKKFTYLHVTAASGRAAAEAMPRKLGAGLSPPLDLWAHVRLGQDKVCNKYLKNRFIFRTHGSKLLVSAAVRYVWLIILSD